MVKTTMPAEMMRRQNARPSDAWLADFVFNCASRELPSRTCDEPRRTNPEAGERSGQFLRMYGLNNGVSVMIRKPATGSEALIKP